MIFKTNSRHGIFKNRYIYVSAVAFLITSCVVSNPFLGTGNRKLIDELLENNDDEITSDWKDPSWIM